MLICIYDESMMANNIDDTNSIDVHLLIDRVDSDVLISMMLMACYFNELVMLN